ncbi:5'-nucleotidase, C-terminal domain containing protein [Acanthamoeba castellanii str. Neff]|uniref:5'-nucleotidase, C-terminal domain containing protein n=1 Tax=Acanthamoeba castellanii (strain ATCC 30010 / Neff) TaxID=1257118 RepID=L8GHJ5_ACACF|nr:5'-nucleotidase, C-terminal domain containing protein [Acanthamoeba castellanii str. Neff]ELR12218.1 5'-nucleotidase, C-terminal domain containing protein [Acanthamoeba castellanii str. Neff]
MEVNAMNETVRTRESNLGSFVADIIRSETGADVVLYNGGTLRSDSTYGPGELTLKHLVSILPFPTPSSSSKSPANNSRPRSNSVSKVPVQEGRFAQISGMRYVYTRSQPAGQRVLHVEVKGKLLQADKKYTLATKAYIADGHDGFESLPGGKVIVDEENARLLSAMVRCYLTKLNALQGIRKVRVDEIVKNAFKKVRFVPKNRNQPSPLAVIAPQVDGRIQEYEGPLPYTPPALATAARPAGAVEAALEEEFREATREALLQEIARLRRENRELHDHLLQFMDGAHSDDDHPAHHHSEN